LLLTTLQLLIMVLPQLITGELNNMVLERLQLLPSLLPLLVLSRVPLQVSLSCCVLFILILCYWIYFKWMVHFCIEFVFTLNMI
jgi:hypothetical protein